MSQLSKAGGDSRPGPILVFDSGLGGLTVLRHIRRLIPGGRIVYCADNAGFPYGSWEEQALVRRIVDLAGSLIERVNPSALVVACNTATTIALDSLRVAYSETGPQIPIVGTVPAIKVAAEISRSRVFSVLATPGTVRRDYTRALIDKFAGDCHVTLTGVEELAGLAEARMQGQPIDISYLSRLISPAFLEKDGRRTDTIVLGCTHYPLIIDDLTAASRWPVHFIDPAAAIARRLAEVTGNIGVEQDTGPNGYELIVTGSKLSSSEMNNLKPFGIVSQSALAF